MCSTTSRSNGSFSLLYSNFTLSFSFFSFFLFFHCSFLPFILFSFFPFLSPGFECRALYLLSHTSSPLCSGYFGDGGLSNYFPRLNLNLNPPALSIPSRLGLQVWVTNTWFTLLFSFFFLCVLINNL
jgi:hypothetical protein